MSCCCNRFSIGRGTVSEEPCPLRQLSCFELCKIMFTKQETWTWAIDLRDLFINLQCFDDIALLITKQSATRMRNRSCSVSGQSYRTLMHPAVPAHARTIVLQTTENVDPAPSQLQMFGSFVYSVVAIPCILNAQMVCV